MNKVTTLSKSDEGGKRINRMGSSNGWVVSEWIGGVGRGGVGGW